MKCFAEYRTRKEKGKYSDIITLINSYCGGFDGKKVLEIGSSSNGDFISDVFNSHSLAEAIGINILQTETLKIATNFSLENGDIRKTRFKDDEFDILISSSVFEHIQNMDIALKEMNRILKPGGFVYSHFGPIWSGSYGHHLWLVEESIVHTYHNTILPPHCHLLMTEQEVARWLEQNGHSITQAKSIANYVFHSKGQNHLMFSDYERLMSNFFEIIFLKGYDYPKLQQIYSSSITTEHLLELNKKYPLDKDNFLYDGITVLLRKKTN